MVLKERAKIILNKVYVIIKNDNDDFDNDNDMGNLNIEENN